MGRYFDNDPAVAPKKPSPEHPRQGKLFSPEDYAVENKKQRTMESVHKRNSLRKDLS
jgi:hypothetical protein